MALSGLIEHDRIKLMETKTEKETINVYGARVHNLKNIDVEIPRDSLVVITGLSGSGKSSLAFDTIFAEGNAAILRHFRPMPVIFWVVWSVPM